MSGPNSRRTRKVPPSAPALLRVRADVLDRLVIGSLMRGLIGADPERRATFGAARRPWASFFSNALLLPR